jgi:hypothetical protein
VMLYETSHPFTVRDTYILGARIPLTDTNSQDWVLIDQHVQIGTGGGRRTASTDSTGSLFDGMIGDNLQGSSSSSGGSDSGSADFLIVEVRRKLDTGDPQDKPILNDDMVTTIATRVIGAWGDTSTSNYHGSSNRVRSAVRFRRTTGIDEVVAFRAKMAKQSTGYFDIRVKDYVIPTTATTYYDYCLNWTQIVEQNVPADQDVHVIGFEALPSRVAGKYVHHLNTYVSESNAIKDCGHIGTDSEIYLSWTPGMLPMAFPDNVGSLWGLNGYKSLHIVRHRIGNACVCGFVFGLLEFVYKHFHLVDGSAMAASLSNACW